MKIVMKSAAVIGLLLVTASAYASPISSVQVGETLRYDWHLRGILSFFARAKFPTSGTGVLQTQPVGDSVQSHLRVSAGTRDYLEYTSRMDDSAQKTYTSSNAYNFGSKNERKVTIYDYDANVSRLTHDENGRTEAKVRPLAADEVRDVLTTIAYLREHAPTITAPLATNVYAEGKPYRVVIQPRNITEMTWHGKNVPAREFRVVAAAGSDKKFPGMSVWISNDEQRVPLRILLDQQYASLDLRLRD